ncbi:MAG: hypothetical protein OXH50_11605 [Gemmatimonadetes bacterium]|nr:hypothetical protein [Gemmatimonadota bacterium]
MMSPNHSRALKVIYGKLRNTEIVWAITGSLGFALHGMETKANDIDLQTDAAGAYGIENALTEWVVRKVRLSVSEKIASHWGELEIEGVKVEIMGALQKKRPDGTWEPPVEVELHREFVPFEGMMVPVLSLKYEEQAYRKLGRTEKADRIKDWLTSLP